MGQKRPSQHKEGKVLQTKKKKIVESYINTSPTDHSALNMVFTLVRSPGNRGTEKEAKKTTTKKRQKDLRHVHIVTIIHS